MQIISPKLCTAKDLSGFHSKEYIECIMTFKMPPKVNKTEKSLVSMTLEDSMESTGISLEDCQDSENESDEEINYKATEYGLGFDCPVWKGLSDYCCYIAGSTMSACQELCSRLKSNDIIINWFGGWHHAHRDKAAGFCFVNDIVLGILVLRKRFQRILYVDLDVHHGDGVEEAFESSKRVFTVSFHQMEDGFYPGSGKANDCGFGPGKGYAVNFPYKSGINGLLFKKYFDR